MSYMPKRAIYGILLTAVLSVIYERYNTPYIKCGSGKYTVMYETIEGEGK